MDWKKIGKRLLFPKVWLMVILVLFSAIALTLIFVRHLEQSWIAYPIYVVAFYTLVVASIYCGRVLPKRYRSIKQRVYDNSFGNRYMTDVQFRTHVSLYRSLAISLVYVGVNLLSFVWYHSMWFVILAGYYGILAVMRFLLVRYVRTVGIGKNRIGELRRARLCAMILLTVNFVLSGAVLMILYQNKGFEYHGVLIYVMAAYTFYITTHAIVDMVKYRKYQSPVMMTTKIISLSAALVSMLSLETAMFAQFGGDMAPENKQLMVALTGAGVSITVIILAVYTIAKSTKETKELRKSQNEATE